MICECYFKKQFTPLLCYATKKTRSKHQGHSNRDKIKMERRIRVKLPSLTHLIQKNNLKILLDLIFKVDKQTY